MLSYRWLAGGLVAYCAIFLLQVRCAPAVAAPLVLEQLKPDEGVVDLKEDGGVVRRGIPPKPADWQKRPPCPKEMGERAINGACYFRIHPEDMKPPCVYPALEHGEFCWRAVGKAPREPSAVSP